MLQTLEEVETTIRTGQALMLAGDEAALRRLPRGNWIAGTIPYFMDQEGGVCSRDRVFVTPLPDCITGVEIRSNSLSTLPDILSDAPEDGFTLLILPAGSAAHAAYAQNAGSYPGIFLKPVVGWISGVHISEIGVKRPQVVNGVTGVWSAEDAVAMHVSLPAGKLAEVDSINVFKPGRGSAFRFPATGFEASSCQVDGEPANFAHYLQRSKKDTRLPLTADYNGAVINVSIQSVDPVTGFVKFYAPVFEGVEYRLAEPVDDYVGAFESLVGGGDPPMFSCNCILNYQYSQLEGRKTGSATGPMTFGEIANLLLNQTLVRLFIRG
jgi:hypothetical protein